MTYLKVFYVGDPDEDTDYYFVCFVRDLWFCNSHRKDSTACQRCEEAY